MTATTLRGLAYVAFQELATRISHRNTGRYSQDPVADRIMARIAADENLHMVFYRDLLDAAIEVARRPRSTPSPTRSSASRCPAR
jgi:acyl-[acyl-carrier-protein] desaturase